MSSIESSPKNCESLLPSFDGLRGCLALWVFASHVIGLTNGPQGFLSKGGIAVDLFMMVSGFLMYWNVRMRSDKEPTDSSETWLLFFVRRFFRLAPLYYVALIPAYLFADQWHSMHSAIYAAQGVELVRPFLTCKPTALIDIAWHASFLYGLFPCTASSNVLPDWSLSLEMQFYAVFPLLYFICRRNGRAILTVGAAIVVAIAASQIGVYGIEADSSISYPQASVLVLRLNCFVVGMLLAGLFIERKVDWIGALWFLLAAFLFQRLTFSVLAVFVALILLNKDWVPTRFGYISDLVFGPPGKILGLRPMRWLGDISYGLYLLHLFILIPMVSWLYSKGVFVDYGPWQRSLLTGVLTLPFAILLAFLGHLIIEKRGIQIGRNIATALKNRWLAQGIVN